MDQYGPIEGAGWLLALSPNALLLLRRHTPVAALCAATTLYLIASATQGDSNAPLAIPLFAYSVGLTRPPRVSVTIVGAAALALSTATFYGPGDPDALVVVVWFLLFGGGWAVAVSVRRNQDRAQQLSQAVDDLEAHQDRVAAGAVADERARIARELHDAVGHAVNVMVLQAGAARLSHQPDKAFGALREIENLGRSALTGVAHVQVTLSCTPTHLHVLVIDDGRVPSAPGSVGGGRGIVGPTERAKVLGGQLRAGPVAGGGFSVEAVLPLAPEDHPSPPVSTPRPGVDAR